MLEADAKCPSGSARRPGPNPGRSGLVLWPNTKGSSGARGRGCAAASCAHRTRSRNTDRAGHGAGERDVRKATERTRGRSAPTPQFDPLAKREARARRPSPPTSTCGISGVRRAWRPNPREAPSTPTMRRLEGHRAPARAAVASSGPRQVKPSWARTRGGLRRPHTLVARLLQIGTRVAHGADFSKRFGSTMRSVTVTLITRNDGVRGSSPRVGLAACPKCGD